MRYRDEHPVDFDSQADDGQAITLIRTVYRTSDEQRAPGAFERGLMRTWRGVKIAAVGTALVVAAGAYPAFMINAHQLDDSLPVIESGSTAWHSPAAGMMSLALARETDGSGWINDHAGWRPEARLTALPAWQAGLSESLGEVARVRAEKAEYEGAPDRDLMMASRLLAVREDGRMGARLTAAIEALARYDGRLAQGLALRPAGAEVALAELDLLDSWSVTGRDALRTAIGDPDGLLGSSDAVAALYNMRGQAQAASIVLAGLAADDPALMTRGDVATALEKSLAAWREVAEMSPLFVGNAKPGAVFPGNDLMSMAFLVDEARSSTLALRVAIETAAPVEAPKEPETRLLAEFPSAKPQHVP